MDGSHFIAFLREQIDGRIRVFDSDVGEYVCTVRWFQSRYEWDGTAIVIGNVPIGVRQWVSTRFAMLFVSIIGLFFYIIQKCDHIRVG